MSEVYSKQSYRDLGIEEYRVRFPNETKELSDHELFDLVMGTDDDMDNDGWRELFTGKSSVMTSSEVNEHQQTTAETLAAIHSDVLDNAINTVVQAKEDYQGGPLKVLAAMQGTYSAEQLAEFPKPGSGKEKGWIGNNPDYFKMKKPGKDGKMSEVTVSWYNVFADNTAMGKDLNNRLKWISRVGDKDYNQADIPDDIKAMNPQERDAARTKAKNKVSTIRAAYKKAAQLMFQIDAVASLKYCSVALVPSVKEGEYENLIQVTTTQPARVVNGVPLDWEQWPVSNFLRLDADKAAEKGGTIAALKETLKRAKPDDNVEAEGKAKPQLIATIDTFFARGVDFADYLSNKVFDTKDTTTYNGILKALGGPGSDDRLMITGMIEEAFTDFMNVGTNRKRYQELKATYDGTKKKKAA